MTRFWITLPECVDFVLKGFERMYGGEIFVPKIPSARITDIAKAMALDLPIKVIGIRPGEKLHEVMSPKDDSHLTLEFDNHYLLRPAIKFYQGEIDYTVNQLGEKGCPVERGFEYNSGSNSNFLSIEQLRALIKSECV